MKENRFNVISTCDITSNKQLVISEDIETGNIVIGKCYLINDEDDVKQIYLKGSIFVNKENFKKLIINENMENFLKSF